MQIKPTQTQIDELLDRCFIAESEGTSLYPGMTYEQGVHAAIEWILGYSLNHPLDE